MGALFHRCSMDGCPVIIPSERDRCFEHMGRKAVGFWANVVGGHGAGLRDFKTGWWRYWMTFTLPWSSIAGFAVALFVTRCATDLIIAGIKVLVER